MCSSDLLLDEDEPPEERHGGGAAAPVGMPFTPGGPLVGVSGGWVPVVGLGTWLVEAAVPGLQDEGETTSHGRAATRASHYMDPKGQSMPRRALASISHPHALPNSKRDGVHRRLRARPKRR